MRHKRKSGFSLVEMVVVVAIMMVVAAIAVPNVMNAIYIVRLNSSATSVSSILQATRQQAVRDNSFYYTCWTTGTGGSVWMVKQGSTCGTTPTGTTQVQVNSTVQILSSGPSVPPVTGYSPQASNIPVAFNSRGVPCVVIGGTCLSNYGSPQVTVGFAIYLKQTRSSGGIDWAAVTVSPAGRVQKWRYNGSSWTQ